MLSWRETFQAVGKGGGDTRYHSGEVHVHNELHRLNLQFFRSQQSIYSTYNSQDRSRFTAFLFLGFIGFNCALQYASYKDSTEYVVRNTALQSRRPYLGQLQRSGP